MRHTQKRRIISVLCLALILCSTLVLPVSAAEPSSISAASTGTTISPRYVNIIVFTSSIDINSSGKATCNSYVQTANSSHQIYLSITLQRYEDGSWKNVKTWSGYDIGIAELTKSYYIVSGYCYRTAASATVYTSGGSYVESSTIYSQSYCY